MLSSTYKQQHHCYLQRSSDKGLKHNLKTVSNILLILLPSHSALTYATQTHLMPKFRFGLTEAY